MKTTSKILILLCVSICLLSCNQTKKTQSNAKTSQPTISQTLNEEDEPVFVAVEEEAVFPGGYEGLTKFLQDNIKYPKKAKKNNIQGTVFVQFTVGKDGSVSNVKVLRDIGGGCGKEAVRVVKAMPKWQPAKQKGKPVRCLYNLPLKFSMNK
ncbi:MAG: energy transducer TonB [Bacteroidales bacterium]|nr:energy transducer TonB [Bacteroidales bacterium]